MASPYPVAAILGSLVFVMRHERGVAEHQQSLLRMLRSSLDGRGLVVEADSTGIRLDGQPIPADAPGASLLGEQLLLHEIQGVVFPADIDDSDILRFTAVVSSFPGTYPGYADVITALGATAQRIQLSRAAGEFETFTTGTYTVPGVVETVDETIPGLLQFQSTELDPESAAAAEAMDPPERGVVPASRQGMDALLVQCREAIDRQDWDALLDAAVQVVESEDDTAGLAGSLHRIEFKRLMTRRALGMIARLAHGDRKQEAVTVLRRFGIDGTEVLMNLLVEASSISDRRGFYSALVQMNEGTTVIIQHLTHPQWYVVRNAADLCGELALAESVPVLAKQTRHPDERVRKAVAEALGKISTPVAMETLAKMLSDPAAAVRLQAVAHLRGRRVRGMTGPISELLQREEDPAVLHEALLALGRIGSPEAIVLLRDWAAAAGGFLRKRSMPARLTAIQALGLAGPPAVGALSTLQRDGTREIRDAATATIQAMNR
ncbi:MAG TPA: HEAT repeat domain-containing protein [Gemmatimonadales bacterium]|nr:HEAT repeat domain-containing protein [Gemmatimonadales bacterium]